MQGHPPSPGVVLHRGTTRSIAMGGRAMERDFLQCGGGGGCAALHAYVAAELVAMGFRVPNACSNPSS